MISTRGIESFDIYEYARHTLMASAVQVEDRWDGRIGNEGYFVIKLGEIFAL